MACPLFGAKLLPEPALTNCQLDHWKQTSGKFESKRRNFHSWKCFWKCRLQNGSHFVQGGGDELKLNNENKIMMIYSKCIGLTYYLLNLFEHAIRTWYGLVMVKPSHFVAHITQSVHQSYKERFQYQQRNKKNHQQHHGLKMKTLNHPFGERV